MPIPDSFLDELVGRTDLTEIVGGYVRLTKRSGANLFGLCPFHSEKTPSFSVSADKQIYYCFGCGKGGGAINFIMEIENLSFPESVEFLAKRAGMTVPDSGTDDEFAGKRRRMLELNRDAARYFHDMLFSSISGDARSYIAGRGISKAMVTRFGLGVAPAAWTMLLDAMAAKGYSRQELTDVGLVRYGKNEGGAYDFFRNRLMFPIIDVRGNVIGFSGRILGDGEPKYLNSPDTIAFSKNRNLFGLNIAKKTKSGMLILVEGNIDVITMHQAGFDCAVASLGTALTAEQVRLMSRYTEKAVIAYDSDDAGRKAALRAISLLEKTGMSVKVVSLGGSKDPDEFLKKNGADAFRLQLERSENHIEYRLMIIEKNSDLVSAEGRVAYLKKATDLLSGISGKPEREIYGGIVAKTAGVSSESVANEVEKAVRAAMARQKKDFEKKVTRPAASFQPIDKSLRYENEFSATAEEGLIRCLVLEPSLIGVADEMAFSAEEFTSPFLARVFQKLRGRISEGRDISLAAIMPDYEKGEASRLTAVLQKPEAAPRGEKTAREYIEKIRTEKYRSVAPDGDLLLEIKRYREMKDAGGSQNG